MEFQNKELQERNEFIISTNEAELKIHNLYKMNDLKLINPVTVYKEKTNEIMEYFYNHGMNYFTKSYVGNIIYYYLVVVFTEATELATNYINLEKSLYLSNGKRLPFKNNFLAQFESKILELKNFEIDSTFYKKIDMVLSEYIKNNRPVEPLSKSDVIKIKKATLDKYIEDIKQELTMLGYEEIAETISEETEKEIIKRKNSFVLKKKLN